MNAPAPVRRDPEATRARLVAAAADEFRERGFEGTNTNRIAARAGFAPQTFYRHFADKRAIFLAVHDAWAAEERALVDGFGNPDKAAELLIAHHVHWRLMRLSLRQLMAVDGQVRKARAEGRRAQMLRLGASQPHLAGRSGEELLSSLLWVERLCEAHADGELEDAGLSRDVGHAMVASALRRVFGPPQSA
jgi:AcrR family transcriptional regulator